MAKNLECAQCGLVSSLDEQIIIYDDNGIGTYTCPHCQCEDFYEIEIMKYFKFKSGGNTLEVIAANATEAVRLVEAAGADMPTLLVSMPISDAPTLPADIEKQISQRRLTAQIIKR